MVYKSILLYNFVNYMVQLSKLFGSKVRLKVLEYFLRNPTKRIHAAELIRKVKVSKKSLFDSLPYLEEKGYLVSERIGRSIRYSLIRENMIVKQLKMLLNILTIEQVVQKIKQDAQMVFLFGSAARGENVEESDLDVLIISDVSRGKILKKIKSQIPNVKPLVFTPLEYARLSRTDKPFYKRIEQDKIRLL